MEGWRKGLLRPELTREGQRPTECHHRTTEDQLELLVAKYGKGSGTDPWSLLLQLELPHSYVPDSEDGELELRFPTFEELQDALNTFLPQGALVTFPQLVSMGPDAPPPDFSEGRPVQIWVHQIGAVEGSAAHRSVLILTPGGSHGSN